MVIITMIVNITSIFFDLQTVVAVAMLVRRFDFQLAIGAPPVSNPLLAFEHIN